MSETVNFFWVGNQLGRLHAACIRSFQQHGYHAVLHTFDAPSDVPEGVETFDASRLLSRNEIVAYKREQSFALTANIYRYRLMEAGLGLYADCDVYCLRPFPKQEWLFGWETDGVINNAVLKVPAGSELTKDLVESTSGGLFVAPWWSPRKQATYRFLKRYGLGRGIEQTKWGTTGPRLLTYLLKKHGLDSKALPIDAFYPVHYSNISLLTESGLTVADLTTRRTYAIHLYNGSIAPNLQLAANTPLAEILSA